MSLKLKYYLLFSVLIFNTLSLAAIQLPNNKQGDSLVKEATKAVFKDPNKAISSALAVYDNVSHSKKTRTNALMVVSTAYASKRDYKRALDYIIIANEFSRQIDNKKLQIEILFRTGILYQQLKIYDKAIEYMEDVEKRCLNHSERDSVGGVLASSYLVKGFVYKDNLNCDIAIEFFDKGLKEYERLGNYNHNRSIGHYNKGNCQILLSEYDNAIQSFNKSIEFANIENASSLVSFAEKGMAEVYTLEGKYNKAISILQSALDKSKNVGDLVLNLGIYKGLFENYLALDQWDDYQKYYDLFLKTQLDIKKSERNSVSVSIKENSKNLNNDLELVQSKFKNRFYLIILIVLVFIISVCILQIKNKKTIKSLQKKIESFQSLKPSIKIK
ncbi:tetratricopeptide repeat protein [Winogradskyella sp. ECml5-4]|uniref:tetratricopeptide repeat protein n=1 Tax=Winogradskyella sp. ECml5-4 TaxID=3110975 RepID=UPI002FF19B08